MKQNLSVLGASVLLSTFSVQATPTWIKYNDLVAHCEKSLFYNEYQGKKIRGLEKFTENGTYELGNCPLGTEKEHDIKTPLNVNEFPYISSKVLMKYSAFFDITEEEIGGWGNFTTFAGDSCGTMSCLEYADMETQRQGLSLPFFLTMMAQESGFNKYSVSSSGAIGYNQILPSTGARYGYTTEELYDSRINIDVAIKNYVEGIEWAKKTGRNKNSSELRKAVIQYHMSGPNKEGREFLEQYPKLMKEIPIAEKANRINRDYWNKSPCRIVYDDPSMNILTLTQERAYFEQAKNIVQAKSTSSQKEIDFTLQCLHSLVNDNFPSNVTTLGFTVKHGMHCTSQIERHPFSQDFEHTFLYELPLKPKENAGVSNSCLGIHYNTN